MKTQTNENPSKRDSGNSFNTLGFSGTSSKDGSVTDKVKFLIGKGIDLGNLTVMERRAKRKLLTKTMMMLLLEIAKEDENWKWHARFESTLQCQDEQTTANGRAYTDFYCKQ